MHFGHVFPEVLPAFELSWTVAALEVPLVCVNHHVVLELVLVTQMLAANLQNSEVVELYNHFNFKGSTYY